MRLALAAAAAVLALAPPRARGADVPQAEVGLRLGVAPALGSAVADVPLSDELTLQFPVQLDAMLRVGNVAAGLYASRGWGRVGGCTASCDGSVWRAGVQGTLTLAPIPSAWGAEPWVGAAVGYEWTGLRRARDGTSVETSWRGWELLAAQGGADWHLARAVTLGPYLLVGVGRYTDMSVDTGLGSSSRSIPHRAVHGWIHLGVRGRLVLGGAP